MSAERAARAIVDAAAARHPELVLTVAAKAFVRLHGLAPATAVRALSQAGRLLPAAPEPAHSPLEQPGVEARQLFQAFKATGPDAHATRANLTDKILEALTVHTYVENEVMYPRVSALVPELRAEILESYEEHHVADVLCQELALMSPESERYDAKTFVLIEAVTRHIEEEEGDWFPKVRAALGRKELQDIGAELLEARARAPHRPEQPGVIKKAADAIFG